MALRFFSNPAQRAAIIIALKKLGRFTSRGARSVRPTVRAVKEVSKRTVTETVGGKLAMEVAKKVKEAPFVAGSLSKVGVERPSHLKLALESAFGYKGATGRGAKRLQQLIHRFRASKVRAPLAKSVAGAAGKMVAETSKVTSVLAKQALEAVGETGTGRILSGTHRVAASLFESPLPRLGGGLTPAVGTAMRDIRHTFPGRIALRLRRPIARQTQRLREFAASAAGIRRMKPKEIIKNRQQARALIKSGQNVIESFKEPGAIREAGGIRAAAKKLKLGKENIQKGLELHRETRRAVRQRGLQNVPLIEPAIVGGVAGYFGVKKIKELRIEIKRQKERKRIDEALGIRREEVKKKILKEEPWLSDIEAEIRAQELVHRHLLVGEAARERMFLSEAELEREARRERKATKNQITKIAKRKFSTEQSKTPKESTLNSLRQRAGRLGQLLKRKKVKARRRRV